MSKTAYLTDPLYLQHDTGQHPEQPARLSSINARLEAGIEGGALERVVPRAATEEEVARIHDAGYIASVKRSCEEGVPRLDADTAISDRSYDAALLSAGAGITAVDLLMEGKADNAFCAVRPPGHHAEQDHAMGFCLFNNVAVVARHAQQTHGLEKIFIFDWDVHHGNGTQHSFYSDPTVFYSSTHQYPFYPGTGAADETGTGDGLGTTLNFPMRAFSGDEEYLSIVENRLIPHMFRFQPDLIIISAGFDAHRDDPLAQIELSSECFAAMTDKIKDAAGQLCQGRLISMLEGGYNLDALADSVAHHLERLAA